MRKLNEDTSLGVHVSLYQVKDLHHPQKQYKVDVNARQLYMTGNAGGVKNKVYKFLPIKLLSFKFYTCKFRQNLLLITY